MKYNKSTYKFKFGIKTLSVFAFLFSITLFKSVANESSIIKFTELALQKDTNINNSINWDELNPRAISFVKDYLDVHEERLQKMKTWGAPYFFIIENILEKYKLPKSLKYLAVIESNLQATAISSAGAVGPWQLMPETAKELGLIVNNKIDERTDLTKSTHAASKYLQNLHGKLGDWLLVIAAYNGGPGRVNNSIKKNSSTDFWEIQNSLPLESRNHVKKFIATHYIFEKDGSETTGKTTRPESIPIVFNEEDLKISDTITIEGRYLSSVIAKYMGIDASQFQKWNPGFDKRISDGPLTIRIPKGNLQLFNSKKAEILKDSVTKIIEENIAFDNGFPDAAGSKRTLRPKVSRISNRNEK